MGFSALQPGVVIGFSVHAAHSANRVLGAISHVMRRGDRREDIFLDDVDRWDFLKTLAEACQKTSWQAHAYCLMRNHFHLMVETPEASLAEGIVAGGGVIQGGNVLREELVGGGKVYRIALENLREHKLRQ